MLLTSSPTTCVAGKRPHLREFLFPFRTTEIGEALCIVEDGVEKLRESIQNSTCCCGYRSI